MDKKIKLLLLYINKKGKTLNLETKIKYSPNLDKLYNQYNLVFWHKGTKINKKTKEEEEYWYSNTEEFGSKIILLKYLVKVKEDLDE